MLRLWEALALAEQLRQLLGDATERYQVAGDARREVSTVDELGVVVMREPGGPDQLAARLTELGQSEPPVVVPVDWRPGDRGLYKRIKVVRPGFYQQALMVRWREGWERVNIWVADRDNWGLILLLRTGGYRYVGGLYAALRDSGYAVQGGRVRLLLDGWRGAPVRSADIPESSLGPPERTRDEERVAQLAGRAWVPPQLRG